MNSEIQSLLKSPLPADRKRGLQMLAKSDDPQTLKVLSALHKRETDPELKQLIVQVGKAVKQRVDATNSSSMPTPISKAAISAGSGINQAAALMQQAQDALIDLDFDNAKALARRAFTLNPDLQHDEDARTLAGDIYGTSADEAVAQLLGKRVKTAASSSTDVLDWVDGISSADSSSKPKRKSKVTEDSITWSQALVSLLILTIATFAINLLGNLGATVITRDISEQFVQELYNFSSYDNSLGTQAQLLQSLTKEASVSAIAVNSIITSVQVLIGTLITYFVVHLVSSFLFGGNGTFRGLIYRSNVVTIAFYVAGYVLGVAIGYFYMQSLLNNMALLDVATSEAQFEQALANMMTPLVAGGGIFLIVAIIWGVLWSGVVGKNYQFSTVKGCFSVIVSHILLLVAVCGCTFIASSMIMNTFSNVTY